MARILLVDDNVQLSSMAADWLGSETHAVTLVHTGFEAWSLAQTNDYDLMILDWDLPDLNGIDILKRFRAGGGTTPIMMLTGHTSVEDKETGLDMGADDYLTKPFHMKELSARVRAALRHGAASAPAPKALGAGNEEILKQGDLVGTTLAANYEFVDKIGQGGFSVVFKALHPKLDRHVAVKMLLSSELTDEVIGRFEREAKAVSRLDHPNVIIIHDFGATERGQPYMVMEYIEGKGLDALIEEREFIPVEEALDILIGVAAGLMHAHERAILHRDIKPSNVMLKYVAGHKPIPKILDFGLAKLKQSAQKGMELTQVQQVVGSPPYMSPEQIMGKPLDERSDVYSFGCLVFRLLTGFVPHVGKTAMEIFDKHVHDDPYTFEEVRPDLEFPESLILVVSQMLEKDPEERPQTMRDVLTVLQKIKNDLVLN